MKPRHTTIYTSTTPGHVCINTVQYMSFVVHLFCIPDMLISECLRSKLIYFDF